MIKKVLFAASEALPFASTGGLADVIGSLPAALVRKGIDARVVMPLYGIIPAKYRDKMEFICAMRVQLSWRSQYCGIFTLVYNGVRFYFLDNEYYFKRTCMYGSFDDGERYAYLCKAIMDMLPFIDFFPDVLHTNDWQTALSVVYLKHNYSHIEKYRNIKSVHTIHNIEYQGIYDFKIMGDVFDLTPDADKIMEYNGNINLTKGAIVCCDMLTTVSPKYAEEIKTEVYSSGLNYILNENSYKLMGILNGIDYDYYNPEKENLFDKSKCKADLQIELGLPVEPDTPMIAMITRLASHKGLDLVMCIIEELLRQNVQFVILGTGDLNIESFFGRIANDHKSQACAVIAYDKELSKRIYAGADMFLMPSKSEPCGLAQMIASRYGTIPLVRETGGLFDSIKKDNGFTFKNYNAHEMLYTIKDALSMYNTEKNNWNLLRERVTNKDFSWNVSADNYIEMYNLNKTKDESKHE